MRIGVDLAPIDVVTRLRGRRWFDRFVYAPVELELAGQMGPARRGEFLAGRFAAKEAVLKVLGRGLFQGVRPCDIAVARTSSGAPEVRLCGSALAAARAEGIGPISISITHRHNLAIAMAIAAQPATGEGEPA
jgi:phosphopantetheine--protein transferase-like protein